jgi:hypothetical protein
MCNMHAGHQGLESARWRSCFLQCDASAPLVVLSYHVHMVHFTFFARALAYTPPNRAHTVDSRTPLTRVCLLESSTL